MTPSSVRVYPVGGSLPVGGFDMVTPYARAPVPIGMAPGPTKTFVDAVPEPDRDASTGRVDTASTPLYAESNMPPSVTGWVNVACTAYTTAGSGLGSGNPWMLVATYVAIEMPPLETNSTRRNVLPTGVRATLVMKSLTDVMVLVPDQKMVTTIASPKCGGAPLNPFASTVVSCSPSVPTCASSAMAVPGATGASVAAEIRGRVRAGPVGDTASREQPATIKAAATNASTRTNELRVCIHCLMWSVRYTLTTLHLRKLCATSSRARSAMRNSGSHQGAARRPSARTNFRLLWRGYGNRRAMMGPMALVRASGKRRQHAAATRKTGRPGVGGAVTLRDVHCAHGNGTSAPPHCCLKRCVPPPGVQRPKSNCRTPRSMR